ncbi:uncharacterized protein LOC106135815 [Amyelois transitella]|uniref:uncharacterized protein LOC106135815 n=1 Tax=Amyelois transitella TaxID=680683 RepID=UPI0029900CEC|nr:uncharacterized protein LOC106135815 [Amyelois transitella]
MDAFIQACVLLALCLGWVHITAYNIRNHPCCLEPNQNLTLAMIIDAFEIYGHDPTDKLDNLWLYQNEMLRIKTAEDQYLINERVHIATDHLGRFIKLHIQELKVLLITLDDVIDNMLTMYENHNSIAAERKATYTGPVPMEFYMSQEYYCGKNVYIFLSELYSDIYHMGRGVAPYCKERSFVFLGFLHYHDEKKYYLLDDPSISFPTDNFLHGLECHLGVCIFRFPFKKLLQQERDVTTLPKAIVKCGLVMYKLPPLTAASCIVTSGSFILDFNIQGLRYRHHDYLLTIPNGQTYYTKEKHTPLVCDHHVCEWNYTNHYGGPFLIPGDPGTGIDPVPPYVEPTPKPDEDDDNITTPYLLNGCFFVYPPNYGSIAGKSYLDTVDLHDDRWTCNNAGPGLYWYPQWMGLPSQAKDGKKDDYGPPFYPHQKRYDEPPED